MKKALIIFSFVSFVIVLGGTAANAQHGTRLDADIPFDFVVGDRVFAAGKYVLRLRRAPSGAEHLEMRDARNRVVYDTFAMPNGDRAGDEKADLVFDRSGGHAVLAKIRTEGKGFSVAAGKPASAIAAKEKKKSTGIGN